MNHAVGPHTSGRTLGGTARFYDFITNLMFLGREQTLREMTVDLSQLQAGEAVLEVGCGTGSVSLAAKRRAGPSSTVIGTDAAPEMIVVARRKAAQTGLAVEFEVAPVETLPFPDGRFDLVLSSLMMHHLPADLQPRALAEIRRVLKPGGRLLVVDFEPPQGGLARFLSMHLVGHGMMQHDMRHLGALMEAAGFTGVEVGRTQHWALSYVRGSASKPAAA